MANQDGWNDDRSSSGGYANRDASASSGRYGGDPRRDEQERFGSFGRGEGRNFDLRSDRDDGARRRGLGPDAGASAYQMSDADPYGDAYSAGYGADRYGYGRFDDNRQRAGYGAPAGRSELDHGAARSRGGSFERNAGYGFVGQGAYASNAYEAGSYDGSVRDRAFDDPAFARSGAGVADWRADSGFRNQDAERRAEHRGRGPKGYTRSDERIREDVNDILTEDPHLDATGIVVETKEGEVTLSGLVHNRRDKRHAEDLAERVSGVKHVQNNLRVHDSNYNAATASAGSPTPSAGPTGTATSASKSTLS